MSSCCSEVASILRSRGLTVELQNQTIGNLCVAESEGDDQSESIHSEGSHRRGEERYQLRKRLLSEVNHLTKSMGNTTKCNQKNAPHSLGFPIKSLDKRDCDKQASEFLLHGNTDGYWNLVLNRKQDSGRLCNINRKLEVLRSNSKHRILFSRGIRSREGRSSQSGTRDFITENKKTTLSLSFNESKRKMKLVLNSQHEKEVVDHKNKLFNSWMMMSQEADNKQKQIIQINESKRIRKQRQKLKEEQQMKRSRSPETIRNKAWVVMREVATFATLLGNQLILEKHRKVNDEREKAAIVIQRQLWMNQITRKRNHLVRRAVSLLQQSGGGSMMVNRWRERRAREGAPIIRNVLIAIRNCCGVLARIAVRRFMKCLATIQRFVRWCSNRRNICVAVAERYWEQLEQSIAKEVRAKELLVVRAKLRRNSGGGRRSSSRRQSHARRPTTMIGAIVSCNESLIPDNELRILAEDLNIHRFRQLECTPSWRRSKLITLIIKQRRVHQKRLEAHRTAVADWVKLHEAYKLRTYINELLPDDSCPAPPQRPVWTLQLPVAEMQIVIEKGWKVAERAQAEANGAMTPAASPSHKIVAQRQGLGKAPSVDLSKFAMKDPFLV